MNLNIIAGGALALCLSSAAAGAAVMTFDGLGLNNADPIPAGYGGIANMGVSGQVRTGFGNAGAADDSHLAYWDNDYSDLVDVVYVSSSLPYVGEFSFATADGYTGTISSFDVGSYGRGDHSGASFAIYDSGWNLLWSHDAVPVPGAGMTLTPGVSFTGIAYLQWGTDWNIGLDNIAYSVAETSVTPAPVPLPAGLPLLGAGVLALGGLRLRSRRKAG